MKFSNNILRFISRLDFPIDLPVNTEVMHPFKEPDVMEACQSFYKKFYDDNNKRFMIIGINPGRFGGGITGIPFTDPLHLQNDCGIENKWQKKQELSANFMYEMMYASGGIQSFYNRFYITSISPLGFTRNNKNLNYYDDKELQNNIKPFVIDCMQHQLKFGIYTNAAFCLGDGKNFKYLSKLNDEMKWFQQIIPLSHPRFIMQYRLKKKQEYISFYLTQFQKYLSSH
jgi:hypothetical protein